MSSRSNSPGYRIHVRHHCANKVSPHLKCDIEGILTFPWYWVIRETNITAKTIRICIRDTTSTYRWTQSKANTKRPFAIWKFSQFLQQSHAIQVYNVDMIPYSIPEQTQEVTNT